MSVPTSSQQTAEFRPNHLAGRTYKMMRETHGLSLREMADLVGRSASHLSRIESGERTPGPDLERAIEEAIAALPAAVTA